MASDSHIDMIDHIGSTAFIIAAYRANESNNDHPIFVDDYAQFFLNDDMALKAEEMSNVMPDATDMVRYRVRYFDDKITEHIQDGTSQVVLLGGGFDMRASKYAKPGVQFFDVDQATLLEYKAQIISENNIHYPSTFIHCNYIEDDLISSLKKGGFDSTAATLFIWEGNAMYIPVHLIYSLFSTLKQHVDRFSIAFDYVSTSIINHTTGREELTNLAVMFEENGSPWVTGFDDFQLLESKTGMTISENFNMDDMQKLYEPHKPPFDDEFIGTYSLCTFKSNS